MDRRRILLIAAVVVAALGTVLVFLYVQGSDNRAEKKFETTEVLVATQQIDQGETVADAAANGKLALQPVAQGQVLPGALTSTEGIDTSVALTEIYPGEQIVPQKFGATAVADDRLTIPADGEMAMSINLTDPARVAGFVNPGSEVAIFVNGTDATTGQPYARVLLTRVKVIAVGSTTPVTTTTTTNNQGGQDGAQVVESLPRTLITLSLNQVQMQRVLLGQQQGSLSFALLTDKSKVTIGVPPTTLTNLFQN